MSTKATIVRSNSNPKRRLGRPKLGRIRLQITLAPATKDIAFRVAEERSITVGQLFDELIRAEFEARG